MQPDLDWMLCHGSEPHIFHTTCPGIKLHRPVLYSREYDFNVWFWVARLGVNGEANLDPADKMIDRIKSQLVVLTVGIASRMKSPWYSMSYVKWQAHQAELNLAI